MAFSSIICQLYPPGKLQKKNDNLILTLKSDLMLMLTDQQKESTQ